MTPCPSVYPPSATGPYGDERGWSGPLRCVMSQGHDGDRHWNTGINWTDVQPVMPAKGRAQACEPWVSRDVAAERQPYTASLRDRLAVPIIQAAFRLASPSYRDRIRRLIAGGVKHGC